MKKLLLNLLICFFILPAAAQSLSSKAETFLNSLSKELRSKAYFALDDEERYNMNYVPLARKGPTFHDFDEKKRTMDKFFF